MAEENMNNEKTLATSSSIEKIIYIIDTNILLHEPFAFLSFKDKIIMDLTNSHGLIKNNLEVNQ